MRLKSSDWEAMVKARDTRIAELEAAASELVELRYVANGERLAAEQQCVQLQARIAALEAEVVGLRQSLQIADIVERANGVGERWEPVIADEKHEQEGKEILIENQGEWVGIRRIGVEGRDAWYGVWLNELGCVVMRKVAADEGEKEWPPASTAIVSEYEAALRPDDMPSFPTCEQMVTALRAQGYVVLTNADTDTLRYVGGECPMCHRQVSP